MDAEHKTVADRIEGLNAETILTQCEDKNLGQQIAQQKQESQVSSKRTQPSPKVTVLLPDHAASKLRDLVQKRDIALIRLGIISVQFENDRTITLTSSTNKSKPSGDLVKEDEGQVETVQLTKKETESNTKKIPTVYDDDEDDEKDEDELVSEVENQHSSYNIHQLAPLAEFADPIELDMYLPF